MSDLDPDAVNEVIVDIEEADPGNWRIDERGWRYYVGPRVAGDGSIDWHGDGWPERTNEHGNVIDYGPQFGDEEDHAS